MRQVHGIPVYGIDLDAMTRCAHWHSSLDIIAIKFKCCGRWYACFDCHRDLAPHSAETWPEDQFSDEAILCGACGSELRIDEYLASGSFCPHCSSPFNPHCAKHYHLYFAVRS